jgi:hypothetical protein
MKEITELVNTEKNEKIWRKEMCALNPIKGVPA